MARIRQPGSKHVVAKGFRFDAEDDESFKANFNLEVEAAIVWSSAVLDGRLSVPGA